MATSTPASSATLTAIGAAAKAYRSNPTPMAAPVQLGVNAMIDFNAAAQATTTLIAQLQAGTAVSTDVWEMLRHYLQNENAAEDPTAQGVIATLAAGYMPPQV